MIAQPDLDALVGSMHSDKNKLDFLRRTYTPGNTDVADRILAMNNEDSSVIESELAHAKMTGDTNRFTSMGRRLIDYYVSHNLDISLKGIVIGWQVPELADYAIAQMTSVPQAARILRGPYDARIAELNLEGSLEYSAEIAQAFGREDVARRNLERLLALQERHESKSSATRTLEKLGRFGEAIDRLLASGYGSLGYAMKLAREHSPSRIPEVAQRGFDSFDVQNDSARFYVECAKVLGKASEAERTLVRYAERVRVKGSPRFYSGVVETLVSLGQEEAAGRLVERVAQHERRVKASERHYDFDRPRGMAQLYHAIGKTDAVRAIYVTIIEAGIRQRHYPSDVAGDINKAMELTGDRATFMGLRLLLHEQQGEFDRASTLAAELGNPNLAESYRVMHQMTQSAQSPTR